MCRWFPEPCRFQPLGHGHALRAWPTPFRTQGTAQACPAPRTSRTRAWGHVSQTHGCWLLLVGWHGSIAVLMKGCSVSAGYCRLPVCYQSFTSLLPVRCRVRYTLRVWPVIWKRFLSVCVEGIKVSSLMRCLMRFGTSLFIIVSYVRLIYSAELCWKVDLKVIVQSFIQGFKPVFYVSMISVL